MEVRTACSPKDLKTYDTARLREEFLIDSLFAPDEIKLVYSHVDRIITGSAVPAKAPLCLSSGAELHAEYFLDRRELGIINIGGNGVVTVDGTPYSLRNRDGLYVGMGVKEVCFASGFNDPNYFTRQFKKMEGITPQEFKRMAPGG